MSTKQKSSKKETEMSYGKLDSKQQFEFPKSWKDKEDVVIVHQDALVDIYGNGDKVAVPHQQPTQIYPKRTYDQLAIVPIGAKTSGFEDMGLKVTPLHDTSEIDEDIQLATNPPAANTAINEFDEAAKKAVEMAKNGEENTPAEEFTEKSQEKTEVSVAESAKRGPKPKDKE